MQRCRILFPFILICLFAALAAEGQIASSPFSEFGIGDLNNGGVAQNQGMGGVGISNGNNWYLNNLNPALLTNNHVTVFQGGMQFEKRTLSGGGNTQNFQNANLNYLAVAFPLKANRWTTSIGLTPYSTVNYNLSYTDYASGSYQLVTYQQTGKGGINQFYWSNGVVLNKYFSFGVKASYMFGSITTQNPTYNPAAYANGSRYIRDSFSGLNLTGGISFHLDSLFKKNYKFNAGFIYSLKSSIGAYHVSRLDFVLPSGRTLDSLTYTKLGGKLTLPASFGFGVSFGKTDRWTVASDFVLLDFSNFNYSTFDGNQQYLGTPTIGYRAGVGGEFVPKAEDFTNYFNRVTYRVGASVEKSTMLINGNPLID
ncbi:MAG TPA: hypothetical protein DGG95_13910, partial [Cytophagales bacterium]|nr:hypothetical protein [Cytophagales bacterium]